MATVEAPISLSATLQPNLYAGLIITYVLALVAVVLRLFARRLKKLPLWFDDWFIVAALVRRPLMS